MSLVSLLHEHYVNAIESDLRGFFRGKSGCCTGSEERDRKAAHRHQDDLKLFSGWNQGGAILFLA